MAALFSSSVIQVAGALLVGAVLLRVVLGCVDAARRMRLGVAADEQSLKMLRAEAAREALSYRAREENLERSWSGYRKFSIQKIATRENEAGDIKSFYLAPHDGRSLPLFQPGQFLTFRLRIPGQPKPVVRCYSLSDAPHRDRFRITVKRVPQGLASGFLHEAVSEGDILDVKAPSGKFSLDMTEEFPVVLIGGGVGVTPMLSMFGSIAAQQPQREVWFLYAVRSGQDLVMRKTLEELLPRCSNAHLLLVLSDPTEEDRNSLGGSLISDARMSVREGRVSGDLLKEVLPSGAARTHSFYTCGPPPMMTAVVEALEAWGVSDDRIHYEAFGPATVKRARPKDEALADGDAAPALEVSFSRSGKVAQWDPAADSLLAFAEANGIAIECSCLTGNCGTCETAIRSGSFEYTKEPSYDAAPGTCLACIAVPKSNLSVDA